MEITEGYESAMYIWIVLMVIDAHCRSSQILCTRLTQGPGYKCRLLEPPPALWNTWILGDKDSGFEMSSPADSEAGQIAAICDLIKL